MKKKPIIILAILSVCLILVFVFNFLWILSNFKYNQTMASAYESIEDDRFDKAIKHINRAQSIPLIASDKKNISAEISNECQVLKNINGRELKSYIIKVDSFKHECTRDAFLRISQKKKSSE